jgi:hypothetical protein
VTEPGYLVRWGWSGQSQRRFETFEGALAYLGYKIGQASQTAYVSGWVDGFITCPDRIDIGSANSEVGLTEGQWERVQEVLSWGR